MHTELSKSHKVEILVALSRTRAMNINSSCDSPPRDSPSTRACNRTLCCYAFPPRCNGHTMSQIPFCTHESWNRQKLESRNHKQREIAAEPNSKIVKILPILERSDNCMNRARLFPRNKWFRVFLMCSHRRSMPSSADSARVESWSSGPATLRVKVTGACLDSAVVGCVRD